MNDFRSSPEFESDLLEDPHCYDPYYDPEDFLNHTIYENDVDNIFDEDCFDIFRDLSDFESLLSPK